MWRGDPDSVICEYALDIGADIIIMGARGASALEKIRKMLLGSVTESVLQKSPVPVLVVNDKLRRKGKTKVQDS